MKNKSTQYCRNWKYSLVGTCLCGNNKRFHIGIHLLFLFALGFVGCTSTEKKVEVQPSSVTVETKDTKTQPSPASEKPPMTTTATNSTSILQKEASTEKPTQTTTTSELVSPNTTTEERTSSKSETPSPTNTVQTSVIPEPAPSVQTATETPTPSKQEEAKQDEPIKTVLASVAPFEYPKITLQVGKTVHINFRVSSEEDLNPCNNRILIPYFDVDQSLNVGDNIVTVTPTQAGTYPYQCWMDMIQSSIVVE